MQFSQGYEASRLGRRLRGWVAEKRTINALLMAGGELLRARARQLVRENPYAANACEAFQAAAVGSGIKPSLLTDDAELKKAVQKAWLAWTDEADADGQTDFYGLQALAARAMFEAGEVFLRFRPRRLSDGLSVPLQLQMLESEMLPFSKNETAANGNVIREGIEFDAIGQRVAYHFYRTHPGEGYPIIYDGSFTRVPADDVIHLYKPLRPGQIRGQPGLTPAMVRLYLLDVYDDAELDRKRTAAMFAGFVRRKSAQSDIPINTENGPLDPALGLPVEDPGPGSALAPLEPGGLQVLDEGEDITFSNPSEVGGSYEAFIWRNLLAGAAGCGVPYTSMTGDTSKSNYSSSRREDVEFRRRMDQFQHMTLVFLMCRPVWQRWMKTAVLSDALPIEPKGFLAGSTQDRSVKWMPPQWDWVDPLKDRQAQKVSVDEGWIARSDVIEAAGYDPEETDARIAADRKRERDMGLDFRPVIERVNVNVAAQATSVDEAMQAVDQRGQGPD